MVKAFKASQLNPGAKKIRKLYLNKLCVMDGRCSFCVPAGLVNSLKIIWNIFWIHSKYTKRESHGINRTINVQTLAFAHRHVNFVVYSSEAITCGQTPKITIKIWLYLNTAKVFHHFPGISMGKYLWPRIFHLEKSCGELKCILRVS